MPIRKSKHERGDATRAIHAGEERHGVAGPVVTPIAQTANFTFASTAQMKRWAEGRSKVYIYTRYGNPTLTVVEQKLAALERGEAALVFSSGMAAITTALLTVLSAGDEMLTTCYLYGGTYRLFRDVFPRLGIRVHYVSTSLEEVARLVNPRTRLLYVESPTNPTLQVIDLRRAVALARRHKLVSIIDNTFATPVLQKPLTLGFGLVMHSATKFLSGHSDLIAGALVGNRALIQRARQTQIYLGGSMDPSAGYLLLRGIKTLEVRVKKQCASAMAIARFLARHPKVRRVNYPGLRSHPDHQLARRQMNGGFGGMMSFDLPTLAAARRFCDRLRVILLAASLGSVESLVSLPAYTSHYRMSRQELAAAGVSEGTVRLSVGIEDTRDLIEDLRQALR